MVLFGKILIRFFASKLPWRSSADLPTEFRNPDISSKKTVLQVVKSQVTPNAPKSRIFRVWENQNILGPSTRRNLFKSGVFLMPQCMPTPQKQANVQTCSYMSHMAYRVVWKPSNFMKNLEIDEFSWKILKFSIYECVLAFFWLAPVQCGKE